MGRDDSFATVPLTVTGLCAEAVDAKVTADIKTYG